MGALLVAAIVLVVGCGTKVPDKYAKLGVPPNPDRVEKIWTSESADTTTYYFEYKVQFSADDYVKTDSAILGAGYKVGKRPEQFVSTDETIEFSCAMDGFTPPHEHAECMLEVPKKH
jgi:hypothetical protein